jgi:predicted ATPase/DNA-binding winged helix-turn-helix (wHTH) protein
MDVTRLGTLELHPAERRLLVAGQPVEIGARAFDLLRVLAENPGRLVTKATLLDRVWPRLVVDENNLPTQVAALRRAIGSELIRTVPGFGYRLELPVSGTDEAPVAPEMVAPPARPAGRRTPPRRLAPMLGREADLAALVARFETARLVTVVGMPGVGKTRLAEEIAASEALAPAESALVVPIAPFADISPIPAAISIGLGLSLPDSVDGFEALERALGDTPTLLVLDSAEHLAGSLAGPLGVLIERVAQLRVLVTSQIPLGIAGEVVYRLGPLSLPAAGASGAEVGAAAAVALFAQRAAAADRGFVLDAANSPLVADICRRLDGNPLALELAAARVPALGVAALHARLDDRLRLLRSNAGASDPRHSALNGAFEWSHSLLGPSEQRVFNRLGAFAGTFPLQVAANCVADAEIDALEAIDLIARLVDRSLVTALPGDPPRYVLSETARCYALDRLAATGELEATRTRMAMTLLAEMDTAYAEYWAIDEARWRRQYLPELDNIRAALAWAGHADRVLAISLYGSTWPLFVEAELLGDGRTAYESLVRLLGDGLPLARLGRFWEATATYHSTGRCDRARFAAELAARMHGEVGDDPARYYALTLLVVNWRADNAAARSAFADARLLEDAAWPPRLLTHGALTEAAILMAAGELAGARDACRRAVRLALTVSERQALAATVHIVELDLACGDIAGALQLGRPLALSLCRTSHHAMRIDLLTLVLGAMLEGGNLAEARATGADLHALAGRMDPGRLYAALDAMTLLACLEGRHEAAAVIAKQADAAHEARGFDRRRPHEVRLQQAALKLIECHLGIGWRMALRSAPIDEVRACALALGLES